MPSLEEKVDMILVKLDQLYRVLFREIHFTMQHYGGETFFSFDSAELKEAMKDPNFPLHKQSDYTDIVLRDDKGHTLDGDDISLAFVLQMKMKGEWTIPVHVLVPTEWLSEDQYEHSDDDYMMWYAMSTAD